MFRVNDVHCTSELFNPWDNLDDRLQKRLENTWSKIFYTDIFSNIDEHLFEKLYTKGFGAPNFPVNILVSLEILKEYFKLTDEDLLDRYHFDINFRLAFGLTDFNENILSIRTIYYFRALLAEHELNTGENLIFHVFSQHRDALIDKLGIKTGLQRCDSVLIGANIKKMSRLMLFHKVLSNLVRDIESLSFNISDEDIKKYLKHDEDGFSYRLDREKTLSVTRDIGEKIFKLVMQFRFNYKLHKKKSYRQAIRLLREQCHFENKKVILKEDDELHSGSMQNPADDQATYRKKNSEKHYGYKATATETCDPENKAQVITDISLDQNNVSDSEILETRMEDIKEETELDTMITDGGFISENVRKECKKNQVDIIVTALPGKKMPSDKMKLSDFKFNSNGSIESCPTGMQPRSQTNKSGVITAYFDQTKCLCCPSREQCLVHSYKKNARIIIDDNRRWIAEYREKRTTEEYRGLCQLRAPVEGLMEKVKPKYLRGRTLFRGLNKVRSRMIFRCISLNFSRYAAFFHDFLENLYINYLKLNKCQFLNFQIRLDRI